MLSTCVQCRFHRRQGHSLSLELLASINGVSHAAPKPQLETACRLHRAKAKAGLPITWSVGEGGGAWGG